MRKQSEVTQRQLAKKQASKLCRHSSAVRRHRQLLRMLQRAWHTCRTWYAVHATPVVMSLMWHAQRCIEPLSDTALETDTDKTRTLFAFLQRPRCGLQLL